MNFYKRYIGDFQRDTGHLSCAEMGVYDRLLDHYYATENLLPADIDACCRISRAMTKDERKAVDNVLKQFFTLTSGGYSQGRADEEIADAQPAIVNARINGKKGGRPKKVKNETQEKPSGLLNENPNETQLKSSPEPEPDNEESNIERKSNTPSVEEAISTLSGQICKSLRDLGLQTVNPQSQHLNALVASGAGLEEVILLAQEVKLTKPDRFNFNYIIQTAIGRRSDGKVISISKPNPKQSSRDQYYAERDDYKPPINN